jgi:hypothetical protein
LLAGSAAAAHVLVTKEGDRHEDTVLTAPDLLAGQLRDAIGNKTRR